jgi:hypothetical protein
MRVYLNRVSGSSASEGTLLSKFVETAFVDEIPADNPAAVKVLALRAPTIPRRGESHPVVPNARVVDVQATPADGVGTSLGAQCWVTITYETSTGSAIDTPWVIRDGSILSPAQTQVFPDTWSPLVVRWKNPAAATDIIEDTGTISFARPTRSIVCTGEVNGRPPSTWLKAIGTVNSRLWQGLKPGYWLCGGVESETRNQGSTYSVQVTFLSRVHVDWSEYVLARNFNTGKFVPVPARDAQALKDKAYEWGFVIDPAGITRVCPYRTSNFQGIFRQIPFS